MDVFLGKLVVRGQTGANLLDGSLKRLDMIRISWMAADNDGDAAGGGGFFSV